MRDKIYFINKKIIVKEKERERGTVIPSTKVLFSSILAKIIWFDSSK